MVWCPYRYLVYEDSFSKKTIPSLYFGPTMNKTNAFIFTHSLFHRSNNYKDIKP